jgi:hypothetical protein
LLILKLNLLIRHTNIIARNPGLVRCKVCV